MFMRTVLTLVTLATLSSVGAQPRLVLDVNPGPGGQPLPLGQISNGLVYFQAANPAFGSEVWVSDGTAGNTMLAADLRPGPPGSSARILGVDNGLVYVSASNDAGVFELWSIASPGTPATLLPGITSPDWLGAVGGRLLMSGSSISVDDEVFWVDAAGGPELWIDVNGTTLASAPCCLITTGADSALLSARAATNPIISAAPHWLVGNAATEVRSTDDNKVSPRGVFRPVLNGYFFFGTEDAGFDTAGTEPWLIDPAGSQATLIEDINPGTASSGAVSFPISLPFKGEVYFAAESPGRGLEIWRSNGVGAVLVQDFAPGEDDSDPIAFLEFAGELYFGVKTREGPQLWKTDGAALTRIATIGSNPNFEAPWPAVVFDDHLLFRVETEEHGQELWATDGRTGQIALVADINPGPDDGVTRPITWVPNSSRLLFMADDGEHGRELWRLEAGYLATLFPIFSDSFECRLPLCP